jgi:hypothetical protein
MLHEKPMMLIAYISSQKLPNINVGLKIEGILFQSKISFPAETLILLVFLRLRQSRDFMISESKVKKLPMLFAPTFPMLSAFYELDTR